jgi:hypothetical protein
MQLEAIVATTWVSFQLTTVPYVLPSRRPSSTWEALMALRQNVRLACHSRAP